MTTWATKLFTKEMTIHQNSSTAFLIEKSISQSSKNRLSSNGSLVIETGKFTGRAAEDKYVVEDTFTNKVIDWKNHIRKMSDSTFQSLKKDILTDFEIQGLPLFAMDRSAGANPLYALGVRIIGPSPSHAIFSKNIFRKPLDVTPLGQFTIYHHPTYETSVDKYSLRSSTVIAINFNSQEIIIIGTGYAGEIKKSIFSVMGVLLPENNILPMHTGANQDKNGKTSLFFGLSGTGKTTLSTDTGLDLIGDDEHGLSDEGIFNIEGGCYAKTYDLKYEKEPEIFNVSNKFQSLLENVVLDSHSRIPLFSDKSITENGRSTYSLESLENVVQSGRGKIPSNIFFLSADALGVLPAVSNLTADQAMFYFLSGYTAKLAGTELGLKGISTTFSHCFGAPFMMRKSRDYGELLKSLLKKHKINVWLVNTGWYGGPYGEGQRYPLSFTRSCIRSIQQGDIQDLSFEKDLIFDLAIPIGLPSVDHKMLNPMKLWKDEKRYLESAEFLLSKFKENFKNL